MQFGETDRRAASERPGELSRVCRTDYEFYYPQRIRESPPVIFFHDSPASTAVRRNCSSAFFHLTWFFFVIIYFISSSFLYHSICICPSSAVAQRLFAVSFRDAELGLRGRLAVTVLIPAPERSAWLARCVPTGLAAPPSPCLALPPPLAFCLRHRRERSSESNYLTLSQPLPCQFLFVCLFFIYILFHALPSYKIQLTVEN